MANQPAPTNEGLKVIGAGFGRTGTLSVKAALEELGFAPCYHMVELFQHPENTPRWEAAANGETVDWHNLLAGYQATVDWPACTFYEELMQAYPDAKVLLTVRDPEKWYASASETIYRISRMTSNRSPMTLVLSPVFSIFFSGRRRVGHMINTIIWEKTFSGNFEDKSHAIAVFNQHNENVKQHVSPDKLLIYNVKEGWEPLCAFLGVEVPEDKPFPHLNDRSSFAGNRMQNRVRLITALLALSVLTSLLLLFLRRRPK